MRGKIRKLEDQPRAKKNNNNNLRKCFHNWRLRDIFFKGTQREERTNLIQRIEDQNDIRLVNTFKTLRKYNFTPCQTIN